MDSLCLPGKTRMMRIVYVHSGKVKAILLLEGAHCCAFATAFLDFFECGWGAGSERGGIGNALGTWVFGSSLLSGCILRRSRRPRCARQGKGPARSRLAIIDVAQ